MSDIEESNPSTEVESNPSTEVIYVPAAGKKSDVWKHFGFYKHNEDEAVRKDKTCCELCKELLNYNTGNTTNMRTHLLRKHNIKIGTKRPADRGEDTSSSSSKQPKITSMSTYAEDSVMHKSITDCLMKYICSDFAPLQTVESPAFRHLISKLNPRYKLPTRRKLTSKLFPELYTEVRSEVEANLQSVSRTCALTTDGWTSTKSNPPKNFEAVTCHYITQEWEMKSVLLETRPTECEAHTGDTLKAHLERVLEEWKISPVGITTDNASNITKAIRLLQNLDEDNDALHYETTIREDEEPCIDTDDQPFTDQLPDEQLLTTLPMAMVHIRCFAHTLNLAAQQALKLNSTSLNNIRVIVKYFRKSTLAGKSFYKSQFYSILV